MINDKVQYEKAIEQNKNDTIAFDDFNSYDAFRIFDIDEKGSISANDLLHGLSDIGVQITYDECQLFL